MNASTPPPAPPSPEVAAMIQAARDADHLKVLEIIYYVAGGLTAIVSCFFLLHFTLFLFMGLSPHLFDQAAHGHPAGTPPPTGLFLMFAALLGFIILLGWTFGALQVYAGRCLRNRRHPLLVFVVAGVKCIFIPWGTLLGVFTILVLSRPSVKTLFGQF